MSFQAVFKRYEFKYLLTAEQKDAVLNGIKPYMKIDKYGRTTIRNLYYDTDSYLLIRRSIDKPVYKEKLRIRTYEKKADNHDVFVELKKKYNHIVYKRRLSLPEYDAMNWLSGKDFPEKETQISKEISWFLNHYPTLKPVVFLSYEREAYYAIDGSDFRVTFDENILGRQEDLSLGSDVYGTSLLPEGNVLMEIKCSGGIPLWMTEVLSGNRIYKTSFSKYGTLYRTFIFPQTHKTNTFNMLEVTNYA